jgi:deoxyribodipyrimidine photolyase-related protein
MRSLVIVLGDQLDLDAAAFDGFDPATDIVWMAEVAQESIHVRSSKPRTVMFLAAMRHFALALRDCGRPVHYMHLDDPANAGSLDAQLQFDVQHLKPTRLVMTAPGDWRVLKAIQAVAQGAGVLLELREDRHFFVSVRDFSAHAKGRKALRMEYFYREQRKRHGILMLEAEEGGGPGDAPVGGQWNFDADNREAFDAGQQVPGATHRCQEASRRLQARTRSCRSQQRQRHDSQSDGVVRA